jgi:hypothetical protein
LSGFYCRNTREKELLYVKIKSSLLSPPRDGLISILLESMDSRSPLLELQKENKKN